MACGEEGLPLAKVFAAPLPQTETELDWEGERWPFRLGGDGQKTVPTVCPRPPGC